MSTDFVIDTGNLCFLCLKGTQQEFSPETSKSVQKSKHSIQYLSNFLELDGSKLFRAEGDVIPKPLEDNLMVSELCRDCATWNNSFSEKCHELDKIKLELISKLASLSQLMSERSSDDSNDNRGRLISADDLVNSNDDLQDKRVLADMLRKDVIKKCNLILLKEKPIAEVQKVTLSEEHLSSLLAKAQTSANFTPNIKLESTSDRNYSHDNEEPDDSIESEAIIDSDIKVNLNEPAPEAIITPKSNVTQLPLSFSLTKSGRLNCDICKKDFANRSSLIVHTKSAHMNVRFRCVTCGAVFMHQANLSVHHRSVHLKKRTKCKFCSKTFSSANNRNQHLRNGICRGRDRPMQHDAATVTEVPPTSEEISVPFKVELHDPASSRSRHVPNCKVVTNIESESAANDDPPSSASSESNGSFVAAEPDSILTTPGVSKSGRFICNVCQLRCKTKAILAYHSRTVHLKIRYQCPECPKQYTDNASYTTHYRNIHLV